MRLEQWGRIWQTSQSTSLVRRMQKGEEFIVIKYYFIFIYYYLILFKKNVLERDCAQDKDV